MGARLLIVMLLTAPLTLYATQAGAAARHRANPVRKIVTLLQGLNDKVTAEGKKQEELHEKFTYYCKNSESSLGASVEASKKKIPELQSEIEGETSSSAQLKEDLKGHKADSDAAKKAMAEATVIRQKENKAFLASSASSKTNLAALDKAIAGIEAGSKSFLQTAAAATIKNIAFASTDMSDVDRQDLLAFLSGESSDGEYVASGNEVLGIMKQLKDDMAANLEDATATEKAAVASYEELLSAKTKQVESLTTMIEDKISRVGRMAVKTAAAKNDLSDTKKALADDSKFLADVSKECSEKAAAYEKESTLRTEELLAIADTIKFLNSDEALELFKKSLPDAGMSSFMQIQVTYKAMRDQALDTIKEAKKRHRSTKLDFISLALRGKKGGFEQVVKMIDAMKAQLKVDQKDDDDKKAYCQKEFDKTDDEQKEMKNAVVDVDAAIDDMEEQIANLKAEIEALSDGIRELDSSVEEATENRKKENEAYKDFMASNTAAKDLLGMAKNRLNKYYNPKLYKAPLTTPPPMLIEEDSFLQVSATARRQLQNKEEVNAVISMMNSLVADLEKDMALAKTDEKDAQEDYEAMMKDSASKRAEDAKTITDKEGALAEVDTQLEAAKGSKTSTQKSLLANAGYIQGLHKECDSLLQNYEARQEARDAEADGMEKSKSVLSGADFSLLQAGHSKRVSRRHFLRRK
eukprot:gnl/TRDRNA2_/TRDRNA2_177268_c4_seq17.p1 gnl/TRDRNA2_/TRDRNA2_177268_c4~~gnl/TRDRNA2_/TRDRNA2_177268_c4_seq17.p1  ORF type:complete len:694 (+),score=258.91 gnl/TRDRNA2_/TRDRNA2_177268_c4_seq17:99-2180(+)